MESTNYAGAPPPRSPAPVAALRAATVILDDRPVLRDVDIEVGPGVTLLRGPNGAGKTTALRALAGLVPLATGTREMPFDVLYLGHRPHLLHGLSARENLRFYSRFRGVTSRARLVPNGGGDPREATINEALGRWGLREAADRPVERLSAGQRRRAALARLDVESCAVALLDEPFGELDADAADALRLSLVEAGRMGTRVVIASHGHADLEETAARVYRLRDGRIEA